MLKSLVLQVFGIYIYMYIYGTFTTFILTFSFVEFHILKKLSLAVN